ncbi:MAG: type I polyketide synthase, partial [Ilumatobacteraceae bacterium]
SSPRQTVIAGPPADVDTLIAVVSAQDRFARRVNMEVASHNALMDPILGELRSALTDLAPKPPTIPFLSTVIEGASVLDADYWVANVRQPVRFRQAITTAGQNHGTFIEISAHPTMAHAITETLGEAHHHSIGTLTRDTDDTVSFHTNLNTAHTVEAPRTPHPPGPHSVLPATPWHHTSHWISPQSKPEPVVRKADSVHLEDGAIPAEWNYDLMWPVGPLSSADTPAQGSWLVVAGADLGAEIRRAVGGDSRVTVLAPGDDDALMAGIADVDNVMYAPDVPPNPLAAGEGYRLFNAARRLATAMAATPSRPTLFMLTRNAQPLSEGDRANPAHAVLWGLGRTLALEHPEVWGAVVDVDESVPADRAARYVLAEAAVRDGEDQVVYRAGVRHVPRLVKRSAQATTESTEIDRDSCHLVVGATGNIGPHLILQLADMGAATIVAVSRQPGSRLDELAQVLSAKGTSLITVAADAADERSMAPLFARFGTDLPPLGGIYLAAFGGGPVTLADMTDDDVNVMFRPKLDALSVLHRLSAKQPVRQFVLFSSISGLLGSRWLAHYAATTTFLDTFAYARRAAGLAASTVNWGFWKSLADNQSEEYRQTTIDSGLVPMPDDVAIGALPAVIAQEAPIRSTVVAADWSRLASAYRTRASLRMIDELVADDGGKGTAADGDDWAGVEGIRELDLSEAERIIADRLHTRLAAIMGYTDPSALNPAQPLIELGMDSLMAVRIRNATQQDFGIEPPVALLLQGASLTDITANTMTQLGLAQQDTAVEAVRTRASQRAAARQGASMRRQRGPRT